MVTKLISIIGLIVLAGCTSAPTCVPVVNMVYQDVDIPVVVVPAPPTIPKPILDITTLTVAQQTDIGQLSKAYAVSLKQLEDYSSNLLKIVNAYVTLSQQNPANVVVPTLGTVAISSAPVSTK